MLSLTTPPHDLTEETLRVLVETFYARVRRDPDLGPVFAAAIPDSAWPRHLEVIQAFWSTVLLRTGRYKGNPFGTHQRLEGLSPALFRRWLALFGESCRDVLAPDVAGAVHERALRIGESLQAGLFFRPAGSFGLGGGR